VALLNEEIKYSYANCGNVVSEEVEEENIEDEDGESETEAADEEADNAADEEAVDAADEEEADEGQAEDDVPFPEELGVCDCLMTHDQDVSFPTDGPPSIVFTYEGVDYMYPPNYGVAVCSDWDADLDPFCTENGPDYCGAEWCFVSSDCEASDATVSNLNAEISYSYATCGYMANFPDEGEEEEAADEPEDDEGEDNEDAEEEQAEDEAAEEPEADDEAAEEP